MLSVLSRQDAKFYSTSRKWLAPESDMLVSLFFKASIVPDPPNTRLDCDMCIQQAAVTQGPGVACFSLTFNPDGVVVDYFHETPYDAQLFLRV